MLHLMTRKPCTRIIPADILLEILVVLCHIPREPTSVHPQEVNVVCEGETRKFQKRPPIGREGVYDENSDYRGKKTNRMEKNIQYIDCYSVKFHRTAAGSMPFCSQEAAL